MAGDDFRRRLIDGLEFAERIDSNMARIDAIERFDESFGVETSCPVEPWEITGADNTTLARNSRYSPSPVKTIRQVVSAAPIRYEDSSFVDFGAGKGRVLLVAADFPFKQIVGVEFSEELCRIAEENVASYLSESQRCHDIRVKRENAATFQIPDDSCMFYFYEPFKPVVTEAVLDNLEASLLQHPREAVLCLVGRALIPLVEKRPLWRQHGAELKSPDSRYYDARLYVNAGVAQPVRLI